jgi:hypothetical protein
VLILMIAREIGAHGETARLATVRHRPGIPAAAPPIDGWDEFDAEVETSPAPEETFAAVRGAAAALRRISRNGTAEDGEVRAIVTALADPVSAAILATALQYVAVHEPILVTVLRDEVLPTVHRAAIGHLLRQDST